MNDVDQPEPTPAPDVAPPSTLTQPDVSGSEGQKSPSVVAQEVLAGHWGRGRRRTERLTEAGYSPAQIQAEVDKLLGKS